MNTSGGGGFCDCGDVEAWKEGEACELHAQGANPDLEEVLAFFSYYLNIDPAQSKLVKQGF